MKVSISQKVPNREGINLAADVYLPDGPGPWPVILWRTPYHRQEGSDFGPYYTNLGYVFVIQDCRGKFESEGVFRPLEDEATDGQYTIDWIANQKWCNERIGMVGESYRAMVQIPAASGGHEALRCILPSVGSNNFFTDWIRYNGCFALAHMIEWTLHYSNCPTKSLESHFIWEELWEIGTRGTIDDVEERAGLHAAYLHKWVKHDNYDEYWASLNQQLMYKKVACAGMHRAGFFDHHPHGQFDSFKSIRSQGATEFARGNQYLMVGPWGHGACDATTYGEWDFGPTAGIDITAYEQRFFDLWLKDIDDGISEEPSVKYFLMGENRWEYATDWPPTDTEIQQWYLDSAGNAQGLGSHGRLRRELPSGAAADSYVYDPQNPVPTHGGQVYSGIQVFSRRPERKCLGPVDQHSILQRDDVLYYRSEMLAKPLTVVGDINLELWITSTAPDTDFIAKLCVVESIGRITALTIGSLRCRYRESWSDPKPLTPGEPTRIKLQMNNIAYTFPAGSRVALIITSSSFPRILPHPNTMAPTWQETDPQVATQEVLHSQGYESRLLLPVIDQ